MDISRLLLDETADERALRANTYSLLARLLAAPADSELIQRLSALSGQTDNDQPLSSAWAALAQAAQAEIEFFNTPPPQISPVGRGGHNAQFVPEPTSARLRAEYQAVFIGVTHGEVMPYASWYRSGFLMEKPLADLRADLLRLGYARQTGVREPEDHVAALHEVMAQLVACGDARQQDFFQRHLHCWIARFYQDLQSAPSARFYRAVGQLGAAFSAFETAYMLAA